MVKCIDKTKKKEKKERETGRNLCFWRVIKLSILHQGIPQFAQKMFHDQDGKAGHCWPNVVTKKEVTAVVAAAAAHSLLLFDLEAKG